MLENREDPGNQVISEVDLLEKLNIRKQLLDHLRRKEDFPYIRLNLLNRVYLWEDVLRWMAEHRGGVL